MTNEEAQMIAALAKATIKMATTLHESDGRSYQLDSSPTATYRQRLAAKQEAMADRAMLLELELDLFDAVMRVKNGE